MNKNMMLILLAFFALGVAVLAGVLLYLQSNDSENESSQENNSEEQMEGDKQENDDAMMENDKMMDDKESDDSMMDDQENNSKYVDYSEQSFERAEGDKKVLFFHADWCPSCREQDEILMDSESDIPAGVTIFKVDYDSESDLKQKYDVNLQHTFVQVDDQGNEINQWNEYFGDYSLENILENI